MSPTDPSSNSAFFIAHPGHELRMLGWLRSAKPRVFVLTDGSGHGNSRLDLTTRLLQSAGVPRSERIYGRLTDRQAYAAILESDTELLVSLIDDLVAELHAEQIGTIVADAAEGYNPVHDLCRMVVGAACSLATSAGQTVRHYEYAVVGGPESPASDVQVAYELTDEELDQKLTTARSFTPIRGDVDELLTRLGDQAFRHESFRRVADWTSKLPDLPLYERIGEERVKDGRYQRVIRYHEHMLPLQERLAACMENRKCAF